MPYYIQHPPPHPAISHPSASTMSGKQRSRARSVEEKDYAALQAQLRAAANRREVLRDAGRMPGEHDTFIQQQSNWHSSKTHSAAASSSQHRPPSSPKKEFPRVRFNPSDSGTAKASNGSSNNGARRGHNSSERETSRERPNPNLSRYSHGWTSKLSTTSGQRAPPGPPETASASWLNTNPPYSFPQPHTQHQIRSHGLHQQQHAQRTTAGPRSENGSKLVADPPGRAATGFESIKTHPQNAHHNHHPSLHQPPAPPQHHSPPPPAQRTDIYLGVGPSNGFITMPTAVSSCSQTATLPHARHKTLYTAPWPRHRRRRAIVREAIPPLMRPSIRSWTKGKVVDQDQQATSSHHRNYRSSRGRRSGSRDGMMGSRACVGSGGERWPIGRLMKREHLQQAKEALTSMRQVTTVI